MSGTLFIVATPIGNLEDMSYRAVRILSEVDLIACEDTRQTGVLLKHYGIQARSLTSFFEHNEIKKTAEVLDRLKRGEMVAVVSDAGTPTISDPAFRLVREARQGGFTVVTIPGPSAAIAALSISGLPTDSFVFEGFLPVKKGRQSRWKALQHEDRTIILYESPHRLLRMLDEARTYVGERPTVVARELTKKFEEIVHGTPVELIDHFTKRPPKGEFVVLIAGKSYAAKLEKAAIDLTLEVKFDK